MIVFLFAPWQRWNPVIGFCEKLLPSDRWQWSDVSGLKHQMLESFELPSPHWEWEADWYVDENFGGDPTEKGVGAKYRKGIHVLLRGGREGAMWKGKGCYLAFKIHCRIHTCYPGGVELGVLFVIESRDH